MSKKLIIIQLNEINFQEVYSFALKNNLKNIIKYFKDHNYCKTEDKFELLDPGFNGHHSNSEKFWIMKFLNCDEYKAKVLLSLKLCLKK